MSNALLEVLHSKNPNLMVGIPNALFNRSHMIPPAQKYWDKYMDKNHLFLNKILEKNTFYDSMVTRIYMDYEDKTLALDLFKLMKKIWD